MPAVILSGLHAYKSQGPAAAVKVWLNGSPANSDSMLVSNTVRALNSIETAYGSFVGHETLATSPLGSRVVRHYLILLYERGPLYVYFDAYRTSDRWVLTGFLFNTKPEAIIPSRLLGG